MSARPAPTERAYECPTVMIATRVSRASAGLLLLGGLALLFEIGGHSWLLRVLGHGLEYPSDFADTHLGRLRGGRRGHRP